MLCKYQKKDYKAESMFRGNKFFKKIGIPTFPVKKASLSNCQHADMNQCRYYSICHTYKPRTLGFIKALLFVIFFLVKAGKISLKQLIDGWLRWALLKCIHDQGSKMNTLAFSDWQFPHSFIIHIGQFLKLCTICVCSIEISTLTKIFWWSYVYLMISM